MNGEIPMSAEPQRKLPLDVDVVAAAPATGPSWQQGVVDLPQPFRLDSGEILADAKLAWQCVGPAAAPLVIALGGISAHRRACAPGAEGWWEEQCGAGRTLDTERYRVLSIDWLGGCDDSTGPRSYKIDPSREARLSLPLPCAAGEGKGRGPAKIDPSREARLSPPLPCAAGEDRGWGQEFPAISTADQARALLVLLNRLGVRRVHLLVGASYGGNVAQQLAALLGDRLRRLVLLSAAHCPAQFGLALRHIQRSILELGGESPQALALARELAVLCYRSTEGVEQRFRDDATRGGVTGWLRHHGEKFSTRFDSAAYRCLGRSLDGHCIDPATIRVPTAVFAVREDLTVPLSLLRDYVARAGGLCELVEVSSPHGHDAFLKEVTSVSRVLSAALEAPP
ncbi:MAG TPA: alpha/beta fold hydrolase [Rudaea sp.]|jgi:homoserine O-acetyltransferase